MQIFKTIICLVFILGFKSVHAQTNVSDIQKDQTAIVSGLTGATKIDDHAALKHRWDVESRNISRDFLANWLKKTGLTVQKHNYNISLERNGAQKEFTGTNIYSIIPATIDSDEYIILGAHFDSVRYCPGANDNATGCALVYGLAKKIAALKMRTKNIIVVFFDQEELGCIGSLAFAQFMQEKKYKVHSVHTADQMGWDKDKDQNIEIELPTEALKAIYEKHANLLDVSALVTTETGSDHRQFRALGFNAVGITEEYRNRDTTPHYHRKTDTFETVNFEYLAFATGLVYNVIEELLSR